MAVQQVAVVGAGAIGGLFAGWLGTTPGLGVNLSVVARGATLQALQSHGLRLSHQGQDHTVAVRATDNPASLGPQDLVVVSVKGPALAQVAPLVQALLGPQTRVLVAMNGVPWWFFQGFGGPCAGLALKAVDPTGAIAAAIPAQQVVGAVVHASAANAGPGVVRHVAGNGLVIGTPAGGLTPELDDLAALLQAGGWAVKVSERIQRDIWYKLWGNMTMNPVSALTGATCDRVLDDPLVKGFSSSVMREAEQIGQLIGCGIGQDPEERHAVTRKLGSFKTSMLQDLEAGRPLEIDALVGVVHEIGRHLGLATPNIDALFGLVRLMAQGRGLYNTQPTP
jgi:2-dehydropantoate 2-reductase